MNNNEIVLDIIKKSRKHLTAYLILEKFQKVKKVHPQELKSDLFKSILKKISLKKYNFVNFELEVSTICNTCK